jgi:hypothetical protein
VPDTHLVTSETEALAVLYPEKPRYTMEHQYIMKSVGWDESIRADMTILPRPTLEETSAYIRSAGPTPFRPFVLQQFIAGPEYCTHALITNGKVRAFVACPSAELLMHYNALPASSALSQAMLLYTSIYAKKMGNSMTGHFSLDFLVNGEIARVAELKVGVSAQEVKDLMNVIYPIECNPRPNTANILFADVSENLAETYLSVLFAQEPKGVLNGHSIDTLVVPKPSTPGYYWIGHDLVVMVLVPLLRFLAFRSTFFSMLEEWLEFAEHIVYWRDGTYEIWDPWPAWWLYVGYWPLMFFMSLVGRKWWSQCSIPLNKKIGC